VLKLSCGLSKKVGEPNYGSRGATVSVEMELDSVTLRQPERLKQHIRCAFDRVREAIEEELARTEASDSHDALSRPRTNGGKGGAGRPATSSQLRLLRVLAGRREVDLAGLLKERYRKEDVADLSLAEASRLIDELGGRGEG
jgi:hypothetical protein